MNKKFTSTIAGASIVITVVGLLSRGFGFFREVIFAAYFGLGTNFEVYLIASVIPVTISTILLYLGQNYYIPIYSRIKSEGMNKENELLVRVATLFFLGGFILAIILFALSNYFLTFYVSSSDPVIMKTSLVIFRIFVFTLPLTSVVSVLSAHLQSQRKFSIPALAQLFTNLPLIILVPFLSKATGIVIIPVSYLIGRLIQLFFLILKTKNSFSLNKRQIFRDSFLTLKIHINNNLLLILVIEVLGQFYLIIDRYFYDQVEPGGIAALNYAITVFYLPIAILSVAISTAIFPAISEHLLKKRSNEFVAKVNNLIRFNTFLFIPIFILFLLYGDIVIKLFFQRGNFSQVDTQMTFSALQYFALSLIFYSIYAIFNKILYGARLIKKLALISILGVIIKFFLNIILVIPLKHDGLALSSSISYAFLCIAALIVLHYNLKLSLYGIFGKSIIIYTLNSLFSLSFTAIIVKSVCIESEIISPISIIIFFSIYLLNAYLNKDYSINLIIKAWYSYQRS